MVRWGIWNTSARTSADINYWCSITSNCSIGFRPPKQKYKRIPNVQLLPSAPTCHKPMLAEVFFVVRWCVFGRKIVRPKSSEVSKKLSNEATKPVLKSRPMSQKLSSETAKFIFKSHLMSQKTVKRSDKNKFSKVVRNCKKLSNEATILIFKSRPKLQKNCPTKRQNKFSKVFRNCKKTVQRSDKIYF